MSAIKKAAEMLRREAESMKECHTVGVGGEWYGESAKAEYDEMIEVEAAAIAERGELLAALQVMVRDYTAAHADSDSLEMQPALLQASQAIARAIGEQDAILLARKAHEAMMKDGRGMHLWGAGAPVREVQEFCARFAALVAEAERERLAQYCESPKRTAEGWWSLTAEEIRKGAPE